MLGVLKADVDNLGLLFSIGFKDSLSISRFANLSRMLNLFFAEYLIQTIQEKFPTIYTVFTGGDDLFVLGAWPEFDKQIDQGNKLKEKITKHEVTQGLVRRLLSYADDCMVI